MTESEIFSQVFDNRWPSPNELLDYANKRHGYMGDDGYYGVTYPGDLDEYQREVKGEYIPEGFVEVSFWDGSFNAIQISEEKYLTALKVHLINCGCLELAQELSRA
ncbi:hypothetical protein [Aeromonas hydrophila]